jgi:hypothetical protein
MNYALHFCKVKRRNIATYSYLLKIFCSVIAYDKLITDEMKHEILLVNSYERCLDVEYLHRSISHS